MKEHTQKTLIEDFDNISTAGWIPNYRTTSSGNVGNILEDLLGIEENNLSLPDAGEWEIKAQKVNLQPNSLLSLCAIEPEPRELKVVPYLVETFGWTPTIWRSNYSANEKSFRQTLTSNWTSRGFRVCVTNRVEVQYKGDIPNYITPYWAFDDLRKKLQSKMKNLFSVIAVSKNIDAVENFNYCDGVMYEGFSFDNFLTELSIGNIRVDFNARSGHNHGTKFRTNQSILTKLYTKITQLRKSK